MSPKIERLLSPEFWVSATVLLAVPGLGCKIAGLVWDRSWLITTGDALMAPFLLIMSVVFLLCILCTPIMIWDKWKSRRP